MFKRSIKNISMTEKVFSIRGNRLASVLAGEEGLLFLSKRVTTVDEFKKIWMQKKWPVAGTEVPFVLIESVQKEQDQRSVFVRYQSSPGKTAVCAFSFRHANDEQLFFSILESEHSFTRITKSLTPAAAAKKFMAVLFFAAGFTFFLAYEAKSIARGFVNESAGGKVIAVDYILGLLGPGGVLLAGGFCCLLLLLKIIKRWSHPPVLVKYIPA